MKFLKLCFNNFRNIKNSEIDTDAPEIFFIGTNGQGKTNFIEAVYLLCYGSSFRTKQEKQIIKEDLEFSSVKGILKDTGEVDKEITVRIHRNSKKEIIVDSKRIEDRKELVKNSPCILFSHDDMVFVKGSPERKRWFLNQTLSLYEPLFIDVLREYQVILRNRNELLKKRNFELIDYYNQAFINNGLKITGKRDSLITEFNDIFTPFFNEITNYEFEKGVKIKYKPRWRKEDGVDQIQKILRKSFKKDAELGMTTTGPHRDNFIFSLGDDDFLKTASTGQVRLLAIALRVAQARYFFHKTGTKPLLLMDDVLLELDQEKRDKCIKQLPEYSQIFFTFLPNENYINYKNEKTMIYCVENGVFSEWKKPVK